MTDTVNLGLPCIEGSQAQKHVTHNDALRILDTLVQLAVLDRDLTAPPGSPAEGQRWIVKSGATAAWAGHDNAIAAWQDGAWLFSAPQTGWVAFVADEGTLLVWNGSAWGDFFSTVTSIQNLARLGLGTTADATNPLSAKINNALFAAKTVAEGGDGNLRYTLSKESAVKSLSFLFQDNYSGRAEVGLTGDDDFHFKVSSNGSSWIDALLLDGATGAAKINAGFFLCGDISPSQITADQNNYNPAGLSGASVLRLTSDASRKITGMAGGADGRVLTLINVGASPVVLVSESGSSSAANRFTFNSDLTLQPQGVARLWYDAVSSRWRLESGHKFPIGLFYADCGGTDQTGATGSANNKVQANNEVVDKRGWYDAATNYRYAPQEPGYYLIFGQVGGVANASGQSTQAIIYKNGSTAANGFFTQTGVSGTVISVVVTIVAFNGSTDYAELYAWVPSGVSTILGATFRTFWGGFKIADL